MGESRSFVFGRPERTQVEPKFLHWFKKLHQNEIVGLGLRNAACENGPCAKCTCSQLANVEPYRRMRAWGLGKFFPWGYKILSGGVTVIVDWHGWPLAAYSDYYPPRIVPPDEVFFYRDQRGYFGPGRTAYDEAEFVTGFALAAGLGLVAEVNWRATVSAFGSRPIKDWILDYRRYT